LTLTSNNPTLTVSYQRYYPQSAQLFQKKEYYDDNPDAYTHIDINKGKPLVRFNLSRFILINDFSGSFPSYRSDESIILVVGSPVVSRDTLLSWCADKCEL